MLITILALQFMCIKVYSEPAGCPSSIRKTKQPSLQPLISFRLLQNLIVDTKVWNVSLLPSLQACALEDFDLSGRAMISPLQLIKHKAAKDTRLRVEHDSLKQIRRLIVSRVYNVKAVVKPDPDNTCLKYHGNRVLLITDCWKTC
ncbi:hypothetical protein Tco_0598333 [Tanacetum coccineum]